MSFIHDMYDILDKVWNMCYFSYNLLYFKKIERVFSTNSFKYSCSTWYILEIPTQCFYPISFNQSDFDIFDMFSSSSSVPQMKAFTYVTNNFMNS